MNGEGQGRFPAAKYLNLVLATGSIVLAIGIPLFLGIFALPASANTDATRITDPGHIDAVYQGMVLARIQDHVTNVSFDPNFNAGASIPLASDGAGRIAAFLLRVFGENLTYDQYRLCIQSLPALVPILIAFAVGAAGGSGIAVAIAPWLALAVWSLRANQQLILAGHCELVLAGPLVTVYLSSLYGYHRHASLLNWSGLAVASLVGWMIIPVPWTIVSMIGAVCWLLVAHRHGLSWNGLAVLSFIIGVSPALPPVIETMTRPDVLAQVNPMNLTSWLTPSSHANAPIDFITFYPVIAGIAFGIVRRCLLCSERSSAAEWLSGCTVAGLAVGLILQQNAFITTASFEVIGLWAAFLMIAPVSIWLAPKSSWLGALNVSVIAAGLIGAALKVPQTASPSEPPAWGIQQFRLGWTADDEAWRTDLRSILRPTARVLWERQLQDRFSPSLVPLDFGIGVLTGRDLDSDDQPWAFARGVLGGRAIADWSDDDLARFCARWNIGWIRAVSPESQRRMHGWTLAKPWTAAPATNAEMFSIDRPQSFFLRGHGAVESATPNQIVLTDVKPEGGEIVISFCWHPGWTTAPSHVGVEPESNAFEPVPLIRLKSQVPVSRLVLRWTGQ